LKGRKFILRIDNQAIATIASLGKQDGCKDKTMQGWLSYLNEFQFDLKHIDGTKNIGADIMSRVQSVVTLVSGSQSSNTGTSENFMSQTSITAKPQNPITENAENAPRAQIHVFYQNRGRLLLPKPIRCKSSSFL